MFNNVHIVAKEQLDNPVQEWDVLIVANGQFVGVIERLNGPLDCVELDTYTFTDSFGRMAEFNTIYEARDYAESSVNPVVVN